MRKSIHLPTVLVGASLLLSACGGSSYGNGSASSSASAGRSASSSSSAGSGAAAPTGTGALVGSASNAVVGGTVLVDSHGMTLYSLSGEGAGRFICASSACTSVWHPLTSAGAAAPSGTVGSLGTVMRPDGARQVTYRGRPLYTFAQDKKPGEAAGQGFKDVGTWSAVKLGATTPSSQSSTQPGSGGESGGAPGRYGY